MSQRAVEIVRAALAAGRLAALTPEAVAVLLVLAEHADDDGCVTVVDDGDDHDHDDDPEDVRHVC